MIFFLLFEKSFQLCYCKNKVKMLIASNPVMVLRRLNGKCTICYIHLCNKYRNIPQNLKNNWLRKKNFLKINSFCHPASKMKCPDNQNKIPSAPYLTKNIKTNCRSISVKNKFSLKMNFKDIYILKLILKNTLNWNIRIF